MTTIHVETIDDYLIYLAQHRRTPPGWAYAGPEEFVLRHGETFRMKPKPGSVRWGRLGQCFKNADKASQREGYTYCEGYAMGSFGLPVAHAWIYDESDGLAFDLTWRPQDDRPPEYLGVRFPMMVVMRITAASGYYGLLETKALLSVPWSAQDSL